MPKQKSTAILRTLFKTTFLAVLAVTGICFVVGVILDLCGAGHGPGEMTFILTFSGLMGGLGLAWFFAAKRASVVAAPLHLSDFQPGDGPIQIRFRNRNYAEQFAGVE